MTNKHVCNERFIGKEVPDGLAYPMLIRKLMKRSRATESGCIEWTGFRSATGYGMSIFRAQNTTTHRLMYRATKGHIPNGMQVLHSCDNPPCMNPDHLRLGTAQENMAESVERRRHYEANKRHCERGHGLAGDNLYVCKEGRRHCKVCARAKHRLKAGWPADLAYSAPKGVVGHVPPGLKRVAPPKIRPRRSPYCTKGHALVGHNRYQTPQGNVECRTCRTIARERYADNYQARQGYENDAGVQSK